MERENLTSNGSANITNAETENGEFRQSEQIGAFVLYAFLSCFIVIANSLIILLIWRRRRL